MQYPIRWSNLNPKPQLITHSTAVQLTFLLIHGFPRPDYSTTSVTMEALARITEKEDVMAIVEPSMVLFPVLK